MEPQRKEFYLNFSREPPAPAPSHSVVPFVGFRDGALAVFLSPVGQIIILKRFPKYLLRKDSIL